MPFLFSPLLHRRIPVVFLVASLAACVSSPEAAPLTPAQRETPDRSTQAESSQAAAGRVDVSTLTGRIVFDNSEDIFVMNANGSDVRQLTDGSGPEFDPMWSPDGSRIVYRDSRRGVNRDDEIFVMNADGSGQTNLTNNPANDWGPAWSPDGAQVAFNSDREGQWPRLFIMQADGAGVRQLTTREAEYPTWSPDGAKIAFMSSEPEYHIYVMNADGTGEMRITDGPGEDGWPAWSPDGTKIAFSSQRDDCRYSTSPDCERSGDIGPFHDIWIMNVDGTGLFRLSDIFGQFSAWSPDGGFILFNSSGGLFLVRPDGSGVAQLPNGAAGGELLFSDWIP